jgi:poly(glycerol-phosphate) alpha-glucosyltransferase
MQTGMDVSVFGIRDEFTDADLPAWAPVPVAAFPPTWPERFGYSPRFLDELIAFAPDITHTHGLWVYPSIAINCYSRKMRSPYLISAHGMLDRWAIQNSRWKKAIAYFLYEGAHLRSARCLRALCEAEARVMRDLRLDNDIAIIPNGIDLPTASPDSPAPWAGFVEPGRKVLLYLGRIHPKKGLANLIRAWAKIGKSEAGNRKSEEWVLAIAGWDQGGHEKQLKRLCDELGTAWSDARIVGTTGQQDGVTSFPASQVNGCSSVVFLGPQFNKAKTACYHYCDGFILPSFSEGVPMAVLEAWVNAKPVLMTPQCNLPAGFSSGASLKMEPSVESVTDGLNEFLRMTGAERAVMGSRGYALAVEQFAWPRIARQMKELYEWMLGSGPRPGCLADF